MESNDAFGQILGVFSGFGNSAIDYLTLKRRTEAEASLKELDLKSQASVASINFSNMLAYGVLIFAAIFVIALFTRK